MYQVTIRVVFEEDLSYVQLSAVAEDMCKCFDGEFNGMETNCVSYEIEEAE